MPLVWSKERAEEFWNTRQCHLVLNDDTLNQKISEMHSENENRQNTFNTYLQEFINQNEHKFTHATRQSVNSKEVV
jgi:type III secretory pathway component EscR